MRNAIRHQSSIKIFCERKGKSQPTFVFIHGTGGDHTQFNSQIDYFSQKGTTFTFDLRGHGKSEKTAKKYTIESFADDIQRLLISQEIVKPILVGFSMGGNIGVELASRHPNYVKALVILDSAFLYTPEVLQSMQGYSKGIKDNFENTIKEIIENSLLPTDRHKNQISKSFLATPQQVWASAFESMLEWDQKASEKLKKCKLPILYVEGTNPLVNISQLKDLCPQLVYGKTVGSGHFVTMDAADQVNAMIDHFRRVYL